MSDQTNTTAMYAAIRTFYGEGHDMLVAASTLVLLIIEDGDGILTIRQKFEKEYNFNIPKEVLKSILKRLQKDGHISYSNFNDIKKSEKGSEEARRINLSTSALRREFNALVANMEHFFGSRHYELMAKPDLLLLGFIDENLGFTSTVLTKASDKARIAVNSHIAEYVLHIENSRPELFEFLQNVFFGRLYLSLLNTRSNYSSLTHFQRLDFYFDTNIIFNLLGFHGEDNKENALELVDLLKHSQCLNLKVFSSTVDEARRVLSAHTAETHNYYDNIPVNSVHYKLNLKGIDSYKLSIVLETLSEKIEEIGIEIVHIPEPDRDNRYDDIANELETWANLLDNPKREQALHHDTIALLFVENERGVMKSSVLEKSRALFISPDRAIHEVTKEIAKKERNFPLSLRPIELASLLWLRNIGDDKIANNILRQSVMSYAREKAISHKLWNVFTKALHDAENSNKLSHEDIGFILSHDTTAAILVREQFKAPEIIARKAYVNSLRSEKEKLIEASDAGTRLKDNLLKRIHQVAHGTSLVLSIITWALLCLLCSWALYISIRLLGVETFSSILGIAIILFPIAFTLVTGKSLKALGVIVRCRTAVYSKIYYFAHGKLSMLLL